MPRITARDIRKGDKVTANHANGSAVTGVVQRQSSGVNLFIAPHGVTHYDISLSLPKLADNGYAFDLVSRPRPPFEAGIYRDDDGDLRFRTEDGTWYLLTAYGETYGSQREVDPFYTSDGDLPDSTARNLTFVTPAYQKPGA